MITEVINELPAIWFLVVSFCSGWYLRKWLGPKRSTCDPVIKPSPLRYVHVDKWLTLCFNGHAWIRIKTFPRHVVDRMKEGVMP